MDDVLITTEAPCGNVAQVNSGRYSTCTKNYKVSWTE